MQNKIFLSDLIVKRFKKPFISCMNGNFQYHIINDLLPNEIADTIANGFPSEEVLREKNNLREYKRVGVDFNKYDQIMEEITYAFHEDSVVSKISQITDIKNIVPDHKLYAGGLSSMSKNNFLNPHLDNSHNDEKSMYRVLNLLYYVSKDWREDFGGNLILYPNGLNNENVVIPCKFNSLVLMETNDKSFHGVSKVISNEPRRCISNYYFSKDSSNGKSYSHVTSFYSFKKDSFLKQTGLFFDRKIRQNFSRHYKSLINHKNWHKRD